MTLTEARQILHRWADRKPGERELVLEADRLLAEAWEKHRSPSPQLGQRQTSKTSVNRLPQSKPARR